MQCKSMMLIMQVLHFSKVDGRRDAIWRVVEIDICGGAKYLQVPIHRYLGVNCGYVWL